MSEETTAGNQEANIHIVSLTGRLGLKVEQDLEKLLTGEIDAGGTRILLDMANVEFVSSSGLRAIMLAYKYSTAVGKKMAMTHVRSGVYKIFKLTASADLFHIFEEKADAIAWLLK